MDIFVLFFFYSNLLHKHPNQLLLLLLLLLKITKENHSPSFIHPKLIGHSHIHLHHHHHHHHWIASGSMMVPNKSRKKIQVQIAGFIFFCLNLNHTFVNWKKSGKNFFFDDDDDDYLLTETKITVVVVVAR